MHRMLISYIFLFKYQAMKIILFWYHGWFISLFIARTNELFSVYSISAAGLGCEVACLKFEFNFAIINWS